uniref:Starch synthase catalytic domain-containing protein n=1 Tax=Noctiluca scintillans TaxID=2966 RepID=A0A7S1AX82_NOCSC|eukprot:CAMPEP_0194482722 /NCGR_PEP_ID=MMETSP0253-20130528/4537_1 /TAXON_ID=2966 /ORGANISM="Noctiluca scintillans" /LENGTH=595 /DNA_ID=CAMNT_0039322279 /DNA_START=101 /DNA_END=1888 /DNA_ORIENTATION=+
MRRNFSNTLLEVAVRDGHQVAKTEGVALRSEVATEVGTPRPSLKHVSSFSALTDLASPQTKARARAARFVDVAPPRLQPEYRSHNQDVPVVIVTSEIAPWSRTGGLGLVAGSYSYEFPMRGHRTMVVTPMYDRYEGVECLGEISLFADGQRHVKLWHRYMRCDDEKGCDLVFVEHPSFFRPGGIYTGDDGKEYDDNLMRFAILSLAALEAPLILSIGGSTYGDKCVFLANDWQSGLVPVYMCHKYRNNGVYLQARVIYVIHNLGYQGLYGPLSRFSPGAYLGLDDSATPDLYYNSLQGLVLNLTKGALLTTDRILTVSPNYAFEIQTPEGGFGLHEILKIRGNQLRLGGILNGIDDSWDPSSDGQISANFSANDMSGRAVCRRELQRCLGLREDPSLVIIGFVGRLTWQKGIDVLGSTANWLMEDTGNGVTGQIQLIMMGHGERLHVEMLRYMESTFRGRVCGYVGFDAKVERQMMAGCDLFVMPSRYEPCGLPQMYAQRYGALPVVTETGGLKDSVVCFRNDPSMATGFHIRPPLTRATLMESLYEAAELCLKWPEEFCRLQRNAMASNFYWPRAIDEYERHIDYTLWDPATNR